MYFKVEFHPHFKLFASALVITVRFIIVHSFFSPAMYVPYIGGQCSTLAILRRGEVRHFYPGAAHWLLGYHPRS